MGTGMRKVSANPSTDSEVIRAYGLDEVPIDVLAQAIMRRTPAFVSAWVCIDTDASEDSPYKGTPIMYSTTCMKATASLGKMLVEAIVGTIQQQARAEVAADPEEFDSQEP